LSRRHVCEQWRSSFGGLEDIHIRMIAVEGRDLTLVQMDKTVS
jgi:hypothetical protein